MIRILSNDKINEYVNNNWIYEQNNSSAPHRAWNPGKHRANGRKNLRVNDATTTKTSDRWNKRNNNFVRASRFFCTFPYRRCTTTTWNCLIIIWRFVEDVNIRQRPSFAFPELWYCPLESNSRQIRQHLTNWRRWNKRNEVWTSANALLTDVLVTVAVVS